MKDTRVSIRRTGDRLTVHQWTNDVDPLQILEWHLDGDFDVEFEFKQERWYEKCLSYLRKMW